MHVSRSLPLRTAHQIIFSLLFSFFSCSEAAACAQDSEEGLNQDPYTFLFWFYQIVFEHVFQICIYKAYRLKIYTPKIYIQIQIQIFFIRMFIKLCVQSLWCLYLYVYSLYTWLGIVFFSLVEFSFSFQSYFLNWFVIKQGLDGPHGHGRQGQACMFSVGIYPNHILFMTTRNRSVTKDLYQLLVILVVIQKC